MKELTINQTKNGEFVQLIIVDVDHDDSYCLNNGSYDTPDDWSAPQVNDILLEGESVFKELEELGVDIDTINMALDGETSEDVNTDVDLTQFVLIQQECYE